MYAFFSMIVYPLHTIKKTPSILAPTNFQRQGVPNRGPWLFMPPAMGPDRPRTAPAPRSRGRFTLPWNLVQTWVSAAVWSHSQACYVLGLSVSGFHNLPSLAIAAYFADLLASESTSVQIPGTHDDHCPSLLRKWYSFQMGGSLTWITSSPLSRHYFRNIHMPDIIPVGVFICQLTSTYYLH